MFPKALNTIHDNAFENSGIAKVTFDQESMISSLHDLAFCMATKLATIENLTKNCQVIGIQCFEGTALTTFTMYDSIFELKQKCFLNCIQLKTFTIPSTSTLFKFGKGVFAGCKSLETIKADNQFFADGNGALFNSSRNELIIFPPASKVRFFSFPSRVKTISYGRGMLQP